MAVVVTGSFAETDAYLRWLTVRAEDFVAHGLSWHAITMLAEALLERETVSSRDVRLIVRRAWESWDIPVPAHFWPFQRSSRHTRDIGVGRSRGQPKGKSAR